MSTSPFFMTLHTKRFGPIAIEAQLAGKIGYTVRPGRRSRHGITSFEVVFGPQDKNPRYAFVLVQHDGRENELYAVGQKPLNDKGHYPKAAKADLLTGFLPILEHFRYA